MDSLLENRGGMESNRKGKSMTSLASEATLDDVPEGAHVLAVLDASGDTRIIWNPDNPDEVANAKRTFDDLKKKGYVAYAVKRDGEKGEVVKGFDPEAEKLILAPQMRGG